MARRDQFLRPPTEAAVSRGQAIGTLCSPWMTGVERTQGPLFLYQFVMQLLELPEEVGTCWSWIEPCGPVA